MSRSSVSGTGTKYLFYAYNILMYRQGFSNKKVAPFLRLEKGRYKFLVTQDN